MGQKKAHTRGARGGAIADGVNDLHLIKLVLEIEDACCVTGTVGTYDDVLGAVDQIDLERGFRLQPAVGLERGHDFADDDIGVGRQMTEIGNAYAVENPALVE